ncbi:MAG: SAM-dependent methyltransferase [Actinomycetota bacterium]
MSAALAERIRARVEADGAIPVSAFVDAALYDPLDGFYATGGRAGRRGDFLTAPEVGPLFGAVISNAVDTWWRDAGKPARFVVAEHGAGPGTLARTISVADGACLEAGALEWVMVERSDAQRRSHPDGTHLRSVADDETLGQVDVVFANELLDNLAFDVVARRATGWVQRLVDVDGDRLQLIDGPPATAPPGAASAPIDTELPIVGAARAWLGRQRATRPDARIVVLDYAGRTSDLAARQGAWLRAFRGHQRVSDWLAEPGTCDITVDLPLEQIDADADTVDTQAVFLRRHGIDALVAEGRRVWEERSAIGDLAALRARSRVTEAEALLDPDGMGAFVTLEWSPSGSGR